MNPFAEDATFDVVIRTDRRLGVTPSDLSPYVLPAGRTVALRLNRYLLQAPRERIVTAEVHVKLGRAIAGSLSISADGVGAEVAVPQLARRWVMPAADFEGRSVINLMDPQDRPADITVVGQAPNEDRVLTEGPGALRLESGQVRAYPVQDPSAVGLVVVVEQRAQIAAQRRVVGDGGDPALIAGSPVTKARWLVLPTLPPKGGRTTIAVQNPGQDEAVIELRLIGAQGAVPAGVFDRLTVNPGRSLSIDLSRIVGNEPVSALLTTEDGTIVVGGASYASTDGGYSATLGLPARLRG
jgi:hypothetical protein